MNVNKVFILGRLTADPQLRSTATGQQVANLGVATNRVWNDKGGQKQESTEFHNVVVWGRQAEVASKFLVKGSLAYFEGRLQTRAWTDQQGQKRKTTEIVAERIQLGPRPGGGGAPKAHLATTETTPSEVGVPEDIPIIDVTGDGDEVKAEDLPF